MSRDQDTVTWFNVRDIAPQLRLAARDAAKKAITAVHRANQDSIPSEDPAPYRARLLVADQAHAGAPPHAFDVLARDVSLDHLEAALKDMGVPRSHMVPVGEEAGGGTQLIRPQTYLLRQDALDGTNNAIRLWQNFSSVQLIDHVHAVDSDRLRARHLAGAIAVSNGWTVSWCHWSTFNPRERRYERIIGSVYLDGTPWGAPEIEVNALQWDRAAGTVAAVAASPSRLQLLNETLERIKVEPSALYNVGGTPLAPALVSGAIECVIEPNPVSLHDSALLLPHQILGGMVTDLEQKQLDYLAKYESSALELSPGAKPINGYIAWAVPRISTEQGGPGGP